MFQGHFISREFDIDKISLEQGQFEFNHRKLDKNSTCLQNLEFDNINELIFEWYMNTWVKDVLFLANIKLDALNIAKKNLPLFTTVLRYNKKKVIKVPILINSPNTILFI